MGRRLTEHVGRRIRLVGTHWGSHGLPPAGSIHLIAEDSIERDGTVRFFFDPIGEHLRDSAWAWPGAVEGSWGCEILPPQTGAQFDSSFDLEDMPSGTILVTPFPDNEGNVCEKMSDGRWLVTGEESTFMSHDLVDMADAEFTLVRWGYGS